jgi:prepilin-type processing-associated H-X9-DG protein
MTALLVAALLPLYRVPLAPPEDTINKLAELWNAKDLKGMVPYYKGADAKSNFESFKQANITWPTLTVSDLAVTVTGTKANAKCKVKITVANQPGQTIDDIVDLELVNDVWQVIPGGMPNVPRVFSSIGLIISQPGMAVQARQASTQTQSLSNLKQIAMAAILLTNDQKDRFNIDPSRVHAALSPYLKNDAIWKEPVTKRSDIYTFNPNLRNVDYGAIEKPAETILFYVGRKGEFEFPYRGRTAIAYADGHVKLVTATEAKQARWKP